MDRIIANLKNNMLALIFTILGIEIIFYSIYGEFKIISTFLIMILVIIFFCIYDVVDKDKNKGTIIYTITTIAVLGISYFQIGFFGSVNSISFTNWLMMGGGTLENETSYLVGSIILITFIFSSMYYYFTVKIIRMSVLLLLLFVSMILYVKGPYSQGNIFIYSYIISFFLMYIKSTKVSSNIAYVEKVNYNIKIKDIGILALIGIIIMFSISLFIPKNNILPNIAALDEIKNYFTELDSSKNSKGFSVQSNKSRSINESTEKNKDRVLYTYEGEKVTYLIDHSFDYYDMGKETWIESKEDYFYGFNVSNGISDMKTVETSSNINLLEDETKYDLIKIKNAANDPNIEGLINITTNDNSVKQMIHPANTYYANIFPGKKNIYLNGYDELFQNKASFEADEKYMIKYYKDTPLKNSKEDLIMRYFNDERYNTFLELINKANSDKEYLEVKSTYTKLSPDTSKKITKFTSMITYDKYSYYDKAKAIEDCFLSGRYVYNLNIENYNGDDFIENFIFKSKEGYCVQYASAMTIMCRSIGIPARYVEGYVVTEEDKTLNGYEVNAAKGHAFVQVYIPGFGWKIFDPTPGLGENSVQADSSFYIDNKGIDIRYLYYVIAILLIIGLISCYLLLTRKRRRIKMILKLPKEQSIELLINESIKSLSKLGLTIRKEETLKNFSIRVDSKIHVGYKELIERYYRCKYACEKIRREDINYAVQINKNIDIEIKNSKK